MAESVNKPKAETIEVKKPKAKTIEVALPPRHGGYRPVSATSGKFKPKTSAYALPKPPRGQGGGSKGKAK